MNEVGKRQALRLAPFPSDLASIPESLGLSVISKLVDGDKP